MLPDDLNNWSKEDFKLASELLNKKDSINVELIKKELEDVVYIEDFIKKF